MNVNGKSCVDFCGDWALSRTYMDAIELGKGGAIGALELVSMTGTDAKLDEKHPVRQLASAPEGGEDSRLPFWEPWSGRILEILAARWRMWGRLFTVYKNIFQDLLHCGD